MKEIFVGLNPAFIDHKADGLRSSIRTYLGLEVESVSILQRYVFNKDLAAEKWEEIAHDVLSDPLTEKAWIGILPSIAFDWSLDICLQPGLTDNLGLTAQIALQDFLGTPLLSQERVCTSTRYLFKGNLTHSDVERIGWELLANPLIQEIRLYTNNLKNREFGKEAPQIFCSEQVTIAERQGTGENEKYGVKLTQRKNDFLGYLCIHSDRMWEEIDLSQDLLELSRKRQLALNKREMEAIRAYYISPGVRGQRELHGLPFSATDVELEALAQTWSEHCKHKIFNAKIHYVEEGKESVIDSLFATYIKRATEEMADSCPWLVSVFQDNAGIIRFDEELDITCKVETHNSPSALDPYGGALTGILGVNRDILGTGIGSCPIANMDVLCFAPPDYKGPIPERLQHPKRVLAGVCKGIEHGGNKSGIPTVNGALLFDERYLGKPLVYCGTVGLMPHILRGRPTHLKEVYPRDCIVVAGGRTGRDGIHGATFSSEEFHAGSSTTAVQIGDPFTQKKLHDFLLEARDAGLYRTLTDNGAGGLSSSVGEMALLSGGCEIHLEEVPLKDSHLRPWEILLSESQERMTFAVDESQMEKLKALAAFHEVEIALIGRFTDKGYFHVLWKGDTIGLLPLDFLHRGVPQLELDAEWRGVEEEAVNISSSNLVGDLKELLSDFSLCSREEIVRRYDCEVGGRSVLKPLLGDAAVLMPGIVISNGICPRYGDVDTYAMAILAVDEALRNQVAVGADPSRIAILDNFCWPDPIYDPEKTPDGKFKLAQLVRAAQGLYLAAKSFNTPIISGKDSMKNDYKMGGVKISIPPTLLITAVGKIPHVEKAVSLEVKEPGDLVYVIGVTREELGGSAYLDIHRVIQKAIVPKVDFTAAKKSYEGLFAAMQEELIASCHDCAEGGLAVALAESAFQGGWGVEIDLCRVPVERVLSDVVLLFSESASRFVVTIDPQNKEAFEAKMGASVFAEVGRVREDKEFAIRGHSGSCVILEDIDMLKKAWQRDLL